MYGGKQASAEDEQRLAELVEKEIVGRNLLGAFGPLLVSAREAVMLTHTRQLLFSGGGVRSGPSVSSLCFCDTRLLFFLSWTLTYK